MTAKHDKQYYLTELISGTKLLITLYKMRCDPTIVGNTHIRMKINRMLMKDEQRNLKKLQRELEDLNKKAGNDLQGGLAQ
tara:strand:+ start:1426 stop:1665 length:240 start_codon:yes stop_codon:yes gene_type:complete